MIWKEGHIERPQNPLPILPGCLKLNRMRHLVVLRMNEWQNMMGESWYICELQHYYPLYSKTAFLWNNNINKAFVGEVRKLLVCWLTKWSLSDPVHTLIKHCKIYMLDEAVVDFHSYDTLTVWIGTFLAIWKTKLYIAEILHVAKLNLDGPLLQEQIVKKVPSGFL